MSGNGQVVALPETVGLIFANHDDVQDQGWRGERYRQFGVFPAVCCTGRGRRAGDFRYPPSVRGSQPGGRWAFLLRLYIHSCVTTIVVVVVEC